MKNLSLPRSIHPFLITHFLNRHTLNESLDKVVRSVSVPFGLESLYGTPTFSSRRYSLLYTVLFSPLRSQVFLMSKVWTRFGSSYHYNSRVYLFSFTSFFSSTLSFRLPKTKLVRLGFLIYPVGPPLQIVHQPISSGLRSFL